MDHYKRILVAVELSPVDEQVCLRAQSMATIDPEIVVDFMYVVEPIITDYEFSLLGTFELGAEEEEHARERVNALVAQYGGVTSSVIIKTGLVGPNIVEHTSTGNYDLIIVGNHFIHGIKLLIGSTTDSILHHVPCDVLAVRVEE